jgi:hypothetical protein
VGLNNCVCVRTLQTEGCNVTRIGLRLFSVTDGFAGFICIRILLYCPIDSILALFYK